MEDSRTPEGASPAVPIDQNFAGEGGTQFARIADRNVEKIFFRRRRGCPLGEAGSELDYKNPALLKKFLSEGGRILSRRVTSLCASNQRRLKLQVKIARILALLPF